MENNYQTSYQQRYTDYLELERQRLEVDAPPDFIDNAMGANFIVKCNGNSKKIRTLAVSSLLAVNMNCNYKKITPLEEWRNHLPKDFSRNFSPELTEVEKEHSKRWWFSLSYRRKVKEAKKETPWRLSEWIHWFEEKERMWFWWGSLVLNDDYFIVSVGVLDDPFASGALRWLLTGCGAVQVMDEEEFSKCYPNSKVFN